MYYKSFLLSVLVIIILLHCAEVLMRSFLFPYFSLLMCRVGDPFKDTAGPSLHVLIKMLATITLVMAPVFL